LAQWQPILTLGMAFCSRPSRGQLEG
jgi:hypothetical protein